MAARAHYANNSTRVEQDAVKTSPFATITLYNPGTTTPISDTIYAAATGGTTKTNGFSADLHGNFDFFLDTPRRVKIVSTGGGGDPLTTDYEPVWGDPSEMLSLAMASLDLKIHDKGGLIFNLEAFSGGVVLNTGVNDPDTAWVAALVAVAAASGGTIQMGPGTFLQPSGAVTNWCDNLTIAGASTNGTIVKRRNNSNRECFNLVGRSNVTIRDLTIDGNRTNNNTLGVGQNAELEMSGTDMTALRVRVVNFNHSGISYGGQRNSLLFCRIEGPALGTATVPAYMGWTTPMYNQGGLLGAYVSGNTVCSDLMVVGCRITGTRSGGLSWGGPRAVIANNIVRDCHREYFVTNPGGNVTTVLTDDGAGHPTVHVTDAVLSGNQIGPTLTPTTASGIELDTCENVALMGNVFGAVPGAAIVLHVASGISVNGGAVHGAGIGFLARNDSGGCSGFTASGVRFNGCGTAVNLEVATEDYGFFGNTFSGSTVKNWTSTSVGTNWSAWGNIVTGTITATNNVVPQRMNRQTDAVYGAEIVNQHSSGSGLFIQGGNTAGQDVIRAVNWDNGAIRFRVQGDGTTTVTGDLLTPGLVYATPGTALTITQGASSPTFSVSWWRAKVLGKHCEIQFGLAITGAGSANNAIQVNVPAAYTSAQAGGIAVIGEAVFVDASGGLVRQGAAIANTGTGFRIQCDGKGDSLGTTSDNAVGAVASGDSIAMKLSYELV